MGVALAGDGDGVGRAVRRRARSHARAHASAHAAVPHALHMSVSVAGNIIIIKLYFLL